MRVFVAGAAGVIGRQLTPLLIDAGHDVTGTTRSAERADWLRALGADAVHLDAFDADAVRKAVTAARPDVIVHQLTDLAAGFGPEEVARTAELRRTGTRNLVGAAVAAGARRLVAQSAAWLYATDQRATEEDRLLTVEERPDNLVLPGILELERLATGADGVEGVLLRYGFLYGSEIGLDSPYAQPAVTVGAAARAAALAVERGGPGAYNVVDDGDLVSNAKARAELGWDPAG